MKSNRLALFTASLLLSGLGSAGAYAFPMPDANEAPAAFSVAPLAGDETVDYTAIVALDNCSGSVVRFTTSLGTDRAMVLTNGHCLGGGRFLNPGEVRVDQAANRTFRLLTKDGRGSLGTLRADRVMYATMTKTDITLYRLVETFDEIEQRFQTTALTIANRRPDDARRIHIASGYWRRMYSCAISGFVHTIREADWTFTDSIRYSEPGCDTIGGTSGSPIIDSETREVIGINNTSNESGGRCTMNNPCEVDEVGTVTVSEGTSYGQQTFWFYSCLNAQNQIDLAKEGCQLAR